MACAAKPLSKSLAMAMANGCPISLPSIFTTKTPHPSSLSLKPKPIKLYLPSYRSSPSLPPLSLKKRTHFPSTVCSVAQTSDWAQQDENNNTVVLDEQEGQEFGWDNQEVADTDAGESEWEGEINEGSAVEAVGEEGFVGAEEPYQEPPEEAKVFAGNLPYDVDSEKLAHLFEKAGVVEIAEVIYNRETDQSRGFGFVTMSTVEEAEKAVEMFDRYDLNGRLLTVNKAAPRGSRPERPPRAFESRYRLYVGNLPWDVDNARLEQVFSEHGKVVEARVIYDRETGRSRGFGFITMSTEAELNDAIASLDGQSLGGRAIRVNVAEERPRRSSF